MRSMAWWFGTSMAALGVAVSPAAAQEAAAPPTGTQVPGTDAAVGEAPESDGVEAIVVTAQKRAENVQDVPISVTAFSGATLANAGVVDVRDLRRITANLNLTTSAQVTNTRVQIRGVGAAGNTAIEPSVAFFVDEAYIPRVGSLLAGLNDIASVEVLRGPQGTLFGRNASIGAVLLRTGDPTRTPEGEFTVSYGNYDRLRSTGVISGPLSDTVSGRFSFLTFRSAGFGRNDLDGQRFGSSNGVSLRGSLRWEVTPSLTWLLKGDYQELGGDGRPVTTVLAKTVTPTAAANFQARLDPDGAGPAVGLTPYLDRTFSRNVRQNQAGDLDDDQHGFVSNLAWETPAGVDVKLVSAYRRWRDRQFEFASTLVPLPLQNRTNTYYSRSHSEELQFQPSRKLFDRLDFTAGLFFFEEVYRIGQSVDLYADFCNVFLRNTSTAARVAACNANPLQEAAVLDFSQNTKSYAAYSEATFDITPALAITGGIRYSKDDKDGSFVAVTRNPTAAQAAENTLLALSQDKITYRVNATWKPDADILLFGSYSTGFKSGGFDAGAGVTAAVGAANRTFNPETVSNYELGIKSTLLDRKLVANVTLYRSDIRQLQFRSYDGLQFRVRNNGEARQQGVEFDLTARPVPPLTLTLSGAYLDSKYLDFRGATPLPGFSTPQDLTGQRLPYSPKWQGATSAQYVGDLADDYSWLARADLAFTTKQNVSASGDNNPDADQPGFTTLGARIALRGPDQRWELALTGQNLTKTDACLVIYNQANGAAFGLNSAVTGRGVLRCTLNDPRTVAIEARARF